MKKFIVLFIITFAFLMPDIRECLGQSITFEKTLVQPSIQYLRSVVQTEDNGYIAVGRTRDSFANEYMYLLRYDAFGDTVWTKKLNIGEAVSLIKTNDNHFAACGIFGNIIKFNISGQILFSNNVFNGSVRTKTIVQTPDNSYFLCGDKSIGGYFYPYLAKYEENGNIIWDSTYTNGFYTGVFSAMTLSEDNHLVLTGYYKQQINLPNYFFLMKVNTEGSQIWFESVNDYFYASPTSITSLNGGEYVISGAYNDNDSFLAKFSQNGTFQWLKGYDTTFVSISLSVTAANDGGMVYLSNIVTDEIYVRVCKTNDTGAVLWSKTHGIKEVSHISWKITQTSDSGFAIVGMAYISQEDVYFLKLDKNGDLLPPIGIVQTGNQTPNEFRLYQNYPNPFNPNTTIKYDIPSSGQIQVFDVRIKIYDMLGREVFQYSDVKSPGSYEIKFDGSNLASGMYFYVLNAGNFTDTKKMVLLK